MTTEKIAVSIPEEILHSARKAVQRGRAPTISAYVAAALEQKTKLDDLEDLLDEMLEATGGPLTAAERRAADAAILGPTRPTPKRRRK
jgi:hypothetical protein